MRRRAILVLASAAFIVGAMIFLSPASAPARGDSIASLPEKALSRRIGHDAVALNLLMRQLDETVGEMETSGLLTRGRSRDFDIGEKQVLNRLWAGYLDQMHAVEAILRFHRDFLLIRQPALRDKAFLLAYAAYLARFEAGFRVVTMTIENDLYEKTLDDAEPAHGIPSGMYGKLKWNTIHLKEVSTVLAGWQYYRVIEKRLLKTDLSSSGETSWLFPFIDRSYKAVVQQLKQDGPHSFAANGLDIVKEGMFAAWFPVQTNVAEWMGDTKVKRRHATLISLGQISAMHAYLQPGDILVVRRNWYLSNVGLPGFWPHAELYIGDEREMKAFFDDPQVTAHYRLRGRFRDFLDFLEKTYPEGMAAFRRMGHDGFPLRVIEAVSEGVKFSSLEEGAMADYVGVMRPRLEKLDIARAVEEAFRFVGRPYDFNFDFLTDSSIVCSELIYKAYQAGPGKKSLPLSLREIAGRKAMPANDIVAKFDRDFGRSGRDLDFVYFLDASEKEQVAVVKGADAFRSSHRRMKWDIAQQ